MKKTILFNLLLFIISTTATAQETVVDRIEFSSPPPAQSDVNRYETIYFRYTVPVRRIVKVSLSKYNSNGTVIAPVSQFILSPALATTEAMVERSTAIYIPESATPSALLPDGQYYLWDAQILSPQNVLITGVSSPVVIGNPLSTAAFNHASFAVYPNPAVDYLNLRNAPEKSIFSIFDQSGKALFHTSRTDRIDVSGLQAGHYFLKSGPQVVPFIKQ